MTHYDVLEVSATATAQEIRAARQKLVKAHHPDRAKTEADRSVRTARMVQINAAWDVLGDPRRRAEYDAELRMADRRAVEDARRAAEAVRRAKEAKREAKRRAREEAEREDARLQAERADAARVAEMRQHAKDVRAHQTATARDAAAKRAAAKDDATLADFKLSFDEISAMLDAAGQAGRSAGENTSRLGESRPPRGAPASPTPLHIESNEDAYLREVSQILGTDPAGMRTRVVEKVADVLGVDQQIVAVLARVAGEAIFRRR